MHGSSPVCLSVLRVVCHEQGLQPFRLSPISGSKGLLACTCLSPLPSPAHNLAAMAAERGSTSPARRGAAAAGSARADADEAARGASIGQRLDQLAARVQGVEARVQDVSDTFDARTAGLKNRVDDVSVSVTDLGDEAGATAASMAALASSVESAKAQFITDLGAELDTHKLALTSVVNEARTEFYTLRSELQTL